MSGFGCCFWETCLWFDVEKLGWMWAKAIKGNLIHLKHLFLRNVKPSYHISFFLSVPSKLNSTSGELGRCVTLHEAMKPTNPELLGEEISSRTGLHLDTLGMLSLTFLLHSVFSLLRQLQGIVEGVVDKLSQLWGNPDWHVQSDFALSLVIKRRVHCCHKFS